MSKQKQFRYTTCSELVDFMYWTGKSMNNILSYFGIVDARISASDKDLPAPIRLQISHLLKIDKKGSHCQLDSDFFD